jgi:hypothetical protein
MFFLNSIMANYKVSRVMRKNQVNINDLDNNYSVCEKT